MNWLNGFFLGLILGCVCGLWLYRRRVLDLRGTQEATLADLRAQLNIYANLCGTVFSHAPQVFMLRQAEQPASQPVEQPQVGGWKPLSDDLTLDELKDLQAQWSRQELAIPRSINKAQFAQDLAYRIALKEKMGNHARVG